MDVSAEHLTHVYGGQTLFRDVSFTARTGQKIAILGRSGSGKSTFLKALIGLVVPTSGTLLIGGESLTQHSIWRLRTNIAYVSQEPDLGEGPVYDRIRRPFEYHANTHLTWDHQTLSNCCRRFRLAEQLLYKEIDELSGGEKQRIALIIALLLRRPILILDEPVSAVDSDIKTSVKEELLREPDRTVFFSSHEAALLEIADVTIDLSVQKERG